MPTSSLEVPLSEARREIDDLLRPKPWIYWADLLLTLTIAYGAASVYLMAPLFSPLQIGGYLLAGFGLFRASSFMHELVHFRRGEMTAFKVAWNLLAGIPLLTPSFLYESHLVHHNSHHYGTGHDGEYLPLAIGPWSGVLRFLSQVFLLPIVVFLRFLIVTPISLAHPPLRTWVLRHMSSFVINFAYAREIPRNAPLKWWALTEAACSLRAALVIVGIVSGVTDWTRLPALYALAVLALGLNHVRTLVAHRYTSIGDKMSHEEQLEDSINITGGVLSELLFPVGLRYHALHHLFPSVPYHNLGRAHRRLMSLFPADSAYHQVTYPSYWKALQELAKNVRAASALPIPGAATWYARRRAQATDLKPQPRPLGTQRETVSTERVHLA